MERLEGLMALLIDDHLKFSDEHNKLLTSQVLLTDRMDRLAKAQERTDEQIKATGEQMKETDARLTVLIQMMDDFIGRPDNGKAH
jgi:hypothetical protein